MKEQIEIIIEKAIDSFSNEWCSHEEKINGMSKYAEEIEQLLIQRVSNRFNEEQFIKNTCFSYRHDYGLMLEKDKEKLRFECSEWMRAIKNSEPH